MKTIQNIAIFIAITLSKPILAQSWWNMTPFEVREAINRRIMEIEAEVPNVWKTENHVVENSSRNTAIRLYFPDKEKDHPFILFIHGGAWVAGNLDTHDNLARYLCSKTESIVVSLEYQNAPEEKFPFQLHQCKDVLEWTINHADEFGINKQKTAVAGDSAGGNLAAALCLMLQDMQSPKFDLQVLINPALDLCCNGTLEQQFDALDILRWQAIQYLQNTKETTHPYASPLVANDFKHLPKTIILLAEKDDLRESGEKFAKKLQDSGVETFVFCQKGVGHLAGHGARASTLARESLDVAINEINKTFYE